ncbi:MAG: hypothetical protein O2894_14030, partial [Planctomycetota bacterium]|nr:hypothetical protein [Planctomycetota bacterium]
MTVVTAHLFGSRNGYQTLGVAGAIDPADRAELEQLRFGGLSRESEIVELGSHVMGYGRRLPSGQVAISRVLPGGRDDVGRLTVEIVTLVFPRGGTMPDGPALLADRAVWDRCREAALAGGSAGLQMSGHELRQAVATQPGIERVAAYCAARAARGVVNLGSELGVRQLLETLAPSDAASVSWGIGLASVPPWAEACALRQGAVPDGRRPVVTLPATGAAAELVRGRTMQSVLDGDPLVTLKVLLQPVVPMPVSEDQPYYSNVDLAEDWSSVPSESELICWQAEKTRKRHDKLRRWGIIACCVAGALLVAAYYVPPYYVPLPGRAG